MDSDTATMTPDDENAGDELVADQAKRARSTVEADRARLLHWQQSYGALREFKLRFEKQHNR
jgi:hypothetical protein